jgi:hypothetical protein
MQTQHLFGSSSVTAPLMKEGETSLLFLSHRDDEVFAGVSPQTRSIVDDDKVYWLEAVYKNRSIDISVSEDLQIERKELRGTTYLLQQMP